MNHHHRSSSASCSLPPTGLENRPALQCSGAGRSRRFPLARGRPGLPIWSSHRQEAGRRWSYDQLDLHRARRLPEQLRGEAAWQWWRGRCRAEGGRLHQQGERLRLALPAGRRLEHRRHHHALHVGCAWTRSILHGRVVAAEQFKLQHCDLLASEAAHGSRTMDQWSFLPGVHWNRIALRVCAGSVVRIVVCTLLGTVECSI